MSDSNTRSGNRNRPLSPHIQIYKPIPTMVASIFHRFTGIGLYAGMFLFAWWLFAAAAAPDYFNWVNGLFGSWLGRIILFALSWALIHHMLGGIKHLVQDTGRALGKSTTTMMSRLQFPASIILTILLWVAAYAFR